MKFTSDNRIRIDKAHFLARQRDVVFFESIMRNGMKNLSMALKTIPAQVLLFII